MFLGPKAEKLKGLCKDFYSDEKRAHFLNCIVCLGPYIILMVTLLLNLSDPFKQYSLAKCQSEAEKGKLG